MFRRDKRQCAYCGTTKGTFQVDHVIPVWDRGTTEMRNLVLACPSCNAEKGASVSERWLLPLLEHPTYQIRITAADEINRLREETMIDHGRAG